jgi:DNA polymerase-3 subunit chi
LAEKALHRGYRVVISVDGVAQAGQLSDQLWSFKPESFLPHQLQTEEDAADSAPIVVVWDEDRESYHELIINLGATVPEYFSRFQRVSEIVVQDESCLAATRNHYQFYRDRGYPLKSHRIAAR